MPIYEYQCTACDHQMEKLRKISDEPLRDCPACGKATLKKKVSAAAFRLKGSGWYETDFKTGKKKNIIGGASGDASGDGGGSGSAEGKDGGKDGSKNDSKSDNKNDNKNDNKSTDAGKSSGKSDSSNTSSSTGKKTDSSNASS